MSGHAVEVGRDTFQRDVIEESVKRPVVVDFWAPWCGPCRVLGPILEKLAAEYGGRFLLAKIDSDREPELSMQFGVRGIPSVKVFSGGRVVDEFTGALPEAAVRQFLDGVVPSLAEPLRIEAARLRAEGDLEGALGKLAVAHEIDARYEPVALDRIEVLIELGRDDEARGLLAAIEDRARDAQRVAQLQAKLAFAGTATDVSGLEARVGADAADLGARLDLAGALAAGGAYERALEQALEVVRRDRGFKDEAGRKTMVRIFDLLGSDSDLARRYRRELASALNR